MRTEDADNPTKLESLNRLLDEVKQSAPTPPTGRKPRGDAARAAIDFASATTVGTVLGYGLDYWQHTSPWGLLGGLLLGTVAGVKQMLAAEKRMHPPAQSESTTNE